MSISLNGQQRHYTSGQQFRYVTEVFPKVLPSACLIRVLVWLDILSFRFASARGEQAREKIWLTWETRAKKYRLHTHWNVLS
jgi:hypothetical protein